MLGLLTKGETALDLHVLTMHVSPLCVMTMDNGGAKIPTAVAGGVMGRGIVAALHNVVPTGVVARVVRRGAGMGGGP